MILNRRPSGRPLAMLALAAALAALAVPAAASPTRTGDGPVSLKSGAPAGPAAAPTGPAAQTIYRVQMPDGSVLLSDTPPPGSRILQARSFAHTVDPQTAERAREQGEYWRRQSEAFDARQRERDRDAQEARRLRSMAQLERDRAEAYGPLYGVPVVVRRPFPGGPLVPPTAVPGTYVTSPGAVNGRGAPPIGSGFASAGNGMAFTPAPPIPPSLGAGGPVGGIGIR